MEFLPQEYQAPKSNSNYVRLQEGENRLRILSKPVLGWEDWLNNKPLRFAYDKKPAKAIDPKKPVKHFWAMIVWNYEAEAIQILSITQATIRSNIEALCKDKDWGAPYFYDIKIIKSGEGTDTEYMVNPLPHKPVSMEIQQAFKEKRCNLEAFLECQDPFAEWPKYTPGIFTKDDLQPSEKVTKASISKAEAIELMDIISECSPDHQKWVMGFMKSNNIPTIYDFSPELFVKMKAKSLKDKKEFELTKENDPFEGADPFAGVA
jgi:hypothetical protein